MNIEDACPGHFASEERGDVRAYPYWLGPTMNPAIQQRIVLGQPFVPRMIEIMDDLESRGYTIRKADDGLGPTIDDQADFRFNIEYWWPDWFEPGHIYPVNDARNAWISQENFEKLYETGDWLDEEVSQHPEYHQSPREVSNVLKPDFPNIEDFNAIWLTLHLRTVHRYKCALECDKLLFFGRHGGRPAVA